jgi:hypothetical protein
MRFFPLLFPLVTAFISPIYLEQRLLNFCVVKDRAEIHKMCKTLPRIVNYPVDDEDIDSFLTHSKWKIVYTSERSIPGFDEEIVEYDNYKMSNKHNAKDRFFELTCGIGKSYADLIILKPKATFFLKDFSPMRCVPWIKENSIYEVIYLSDYIMIQKHNMQHLVFEKIK